MAEKRRLNLSFSLSSPYQREAWRILRAIPAGQRTDAVCRMVCKAQEQDALLSAMRGLIREELRDIQCKSEQTKQGRVMVLTATKETTPQHKPPHPHKYRRGVER